MADDCSGTLELASGWGFIGSWLRDVLLFWLRFLTFRWGPVPWESNILNNSFSI